MIAQLLTVEICGQTNIDVNNISYDSRYTNSGTLFICIAGTADDGHKYLEDAVNKGACAIVAEYSRITFDQRQLLGEKNIPFVLVLDARKAMAIISAKFLDYPSDDLRAIGVTGTKGKSTTVNLIDQLLNYGLNTETGLISTVNTRIAGRYEKLATTTPGPWELQSMLSEIKISGASHGILEVSSHAVTQQRISGVDFDIAVFTNLGEDHLDYHGTMENYKQAKGKFFTSLGTWPVKNQKPKLAVINVDDDYSDYMLKQTFVQVITYGFNDHALVRGELIESSGSATEMNVHSPWGSCTIRTPLVGKFNCYNILAAVAVALFEGVSFSSITSILSEPINIPGRFEKIDIGQGFAVIVDFAHTAASLQNVLSAVKDMTSGKVAVVFGCGGERDKGKRPVMGRIACEYSDQVFITSDNPRAEYPDKIIDDILSGISTECLSRAEIDSDRLSAINKALEWAEPGDSVLIAGKGHETTQEINGQIFNFDDRLIVREKLMQMGY